MSDGGHFDTTREAVAVAARSAGPATDRYRSALERYLAAVADTGGKPAKTDHVLHEALYWNLENNLVRDVMTGQVVSVHEDASFKEIVDTLARHRVSAVPVVDADQNVLGVVSESDLLAKVVAGGDPRPRIRGGHPTKALTRRKAHGEVAHELMSTPAITTRPEASVVHAARAAAMAHVRRLPVVDTAGALVGMVTRSDMLRVFLRDDEELRTHIVDVFAGQFCIDTSAVEVAVHDGVVTLAGRVDRRALVAPLLDGVRATAGVVGLHDNLTYRVDDTILTPPRGPLY
jgi:CBS domain-containing protein